MNPRQVADYMFNQDYFSQWMNIKMIEVKENYCLIEMPIKKDMLNGLKTVHGGVTFAFADSALGNSRKNRNAQCLGARNIKYRRSTLAN